MSKYIIEIKPEYEDSFKGLMILGTKDSNLFVDTLAVENLEELNSDYINEHFGELQDDAYQRGLNDAWEAAKKIFGYEMDGGIPINELGKVFGYAEDAIFCTADIIRHNTASEAIAKLKAYEEKQKADDEIKVGDEVEISQSDANGIWVVIKVEKHDGYEAYCAINKDGDIYFEEEQDRVTKTGRHFDIQSILEDMRE